MEHDIVTQKEWLDARVAFLAKEKEFTNARDALSQARRALPWVKVDKTYEFEGPNGTETLEQRTIDPLPRFGLGAGTRPGRRLFG